MTTESTKPALVILAAGRARRYGGCKPLAPVGIRGEAALVRAYDAHGVALFGGDHEDGASGGQNRK